MSGSSRRAQALAAVLRGKGLDDERVLAALATVPRDRFVPEAVRDQAWEDHALPIGEGQTISQPYIVALMTSAAQLEPSHRLLEIGTGSGYAAAVASRVCAHVDTIERHEGLAATARQRLTDLGFDNVAVHVGDGTMGLAAHAPFDAIIVTAGGPKVPESLLWQLAPGGRLVMPVGDRDYQRLVRITRGAEGFTEEFISDVRFVPLIGREGWGGGGLPLLQ